MEGVMLPSLILIDDFLADPWSVRRRALALDYDPKFKKGNYPGLMSTTPLEVRGMEQAVSQRVGVPLMAAPRTMHGHCRLTLAGDTGKSGVHIDPAAYSGILYLTPPEHCRGGTDFFRHRPTGLDRVPQSERELAPTGYRDINRLIEEVVNGDTLKPARWEKTMTVPMRFNRLLLFSPWMFHNAAKGFGKGPEDGRLVQTLFFAAAPRPA